ncbi:MAG TPA: FCD domain-containing protein [Falsiroseomonas sp.]|jgi:DNA-binding GntR family transcriptional regulator|nr:FCD domain-containing protein [Falsiroseomonas sp.]
MPVTPAARTGKGPRNAALRKAADNAAAKRINADASRRARSAEALGIDVARRIEQLILDGTLPPGERLNEVRLARSLGVSRGPVREAARSLERTGLVTVIRNRGAFVRSLGLAEALDIYEINGVLFGLAAGGAAGTVRAAQARVMRRMVEAMDAAVAREAREEFFQVNSDFHAHVMECGRNAEAQLLYGQLTRKLLLLRRRSFEQADHMCQANREHRALMEAILAGDAVRARRLAEAHARRGRARFLNAIGHPSKKPARKKEAP